METSKIQHLQHTGTEQGKDGKTYHRFDCILENGMVGQVSAQTMTRWTIGEEVVIKSHKQTTYGPRLSLDKVGYANKPRTTAPAGNDNRQESIVKQWAIREAQTFLANTTTAPDKVTVYDVWGKARQFKSMHDNFETFGERYKEQTSQRAHELAPDNVPPVTTPPPGDADLPF